MTYSVIQPPFTLIFKEMTQHDLQDYRHWFLQVIPSRIIELQRAIEISEESVAWKPDFSQTSVEILGQWLSLQVETRVRSKEEIDQIKSRSIYEFYVSNEELTNKTFSLAMDVGMYFGETLIRRYPNLSWDQSLRDKRFADYGQVVVLGFRRSTLNPIWIVVTFCYGLAQGRLTANRLNEVYSYWARLADEANQIG